MNGTDPTMVDSVRRTSGRIRSAPEHFMPEPITPRKSGKKKIILKELSKTVIQTSKSRSSAKTRIPEPEFLLIYCEQPVDILWQRINIREFCIRFESLMQLQPRHAMSIADPTASWNEYICKSVICSLFSIIYDKISLDYAAKNPASGEENRKEALEYSATYRESITRCSAESEKLWIYVEEFCDCFSNYLQNQEDGEDMSEDDEESRNGQINGKSRAGSHPPGVVRKFNDEFERESYRLELIERLMVLAVSSTKARQAINSDFENSKSLQQEFSDKIKKTKALIEASRKKEDKSDKNKASKAKTDKKLREYQEQLFQYERQLYFETTLMNRIRTRPIGSDHNGNNYWIFQQKLPASIRSGIGAFDAPSGGLNSSWGSGWVFIEKNPLHSSPVSSESIKVDGSIHSVTGENVPVKRRKKMFQKVNLNDSLYYISGKSNLERLVAWVKAKEVKDTSLSRELEKYAKYL